MAKAFTLGTSDSIIAKLSGAVATTQPTFNAAWVDTTADTASSNKGSLNGASEVTLVAAPSADQRQVHSLRVYNEDTAAVTLTVQVANGASRYTLGKWTLAVGGAVDVIDPADMVAGSSYEVPLTFASGLTRTANAVAADTNTGKAGGQTIIGGTLTTQGLTIRANAADTTTGALTMQGASLAAPATTVPTATLTTAIADNTSTTQSASTAYAKGQDAVLRRHPTQAVYQTYAASASSGIAVADNTNLDQPTNNFTLNLTVGLPDWTPAAISYLAFKKDSNGYITYIGTDGYLVFVIYRPTGTAYVATASPSFVDGTMHALTFVCARETATVDGSLVIYADGVQLGNAVAIPASVTNAGADLSGATSFYAMGTSAVRNAGACSHVSVYNRALTAAEVLDLYRNDIAYADKWASQTSLNTATLANNATKAYDTFDGASATAFHAITDGADIARGGTTDAIAFVSGSKYRISFTCSAITGTAPTYGAAKDVDGTALSGAVLTNVAAAGSNQYEFTAGETATGTCLWLNTAASSEFTISGFSITKIGATFALQPEGIQINPGQWHDSSTNKLHAMQPAAGSSLTRPKQEFEIRWVNTWAGTNEAQYVGGLNQAILPVGCYVTNIIGVVAGADVQDVILGDGSDTDHWVAITSGLAAGTVAFTIANAISDGTNYKMVIDPDTNCTMSITWTIKGIILS